MDQKYTEIKYRLIRGILMITISFILISFNSRLNILFYILQNFMILYILYIEYDIHILLWVFWINYSVYTILADIILDNIISNISHIFIGIFISSLIFIWILIFRKNTKENVKNILFIILFLFNILPFRNNNAFDEIYIGGYFRSTLYSILYIINFFNLNNNNNKKSIFWGDSIIIAHYPLFMHHKILFFILIIHILYIIFNIRAKTKKKNKNKFTNLQEENILPIHNENTLYNAETIDSTIQEEQYSQQDKWTIPKLMKPDYETDQSVDIFLQMIQTGMDRYQKKTT